MDIILNNNRVSNSSAAIIVDSSGASANSNNNSSNNKQQKGFNPPPISNSIKIKTTTPSAATTHIQHSSIRTSSSSLSPPAGQHYTTIMTGSLSPSTTNNNFSLLNDIYFHNLNDINDVVNKNNNNNNSNSNTNLNSLTTTTTTTSTNSRSGSGSGNSNSSNNTLPAVTSVVVGPPKHDVDLIVQTTKQEDARFMGRKKRRNSSVSKVFLGDFLKLSSKVSILKMMSKYGDNRILFSDVLTKMNKRNKMQERIIIITDKSIYNVHPIDYKLKRRISLDNVTALSMSTMEDNFIIFHVNSEYDYVLISGRKIEIATILVEAYYNLAFFHITPFDPLNGPNPSTVVSGTTTIVSSNTTNNNTNNGISITGGNSVTSSPQHKSNNNNNQGSHPSPSSSPSTASTALNMITTISNTLFFTKQ